MTNIQPKPQAVSDAAEKRQRKGAHHRVKAHSIIKYIFVYVTNSQTHKLNRQSVNLGLVDTSKTVCFLGSENVMKKRHIQMIYYDLPIKYGIISLNSYHFIIFSVDFSIVYSITVPVEPIMSVFGPFECRTIRQFLIAHHFRFVCR